MSKLPVGWTSAKVSDVVTLNPKNNCPDDLETGFVPMSMLGTNYRSMINFERRSWSQIKKGYTHFADGDVLLAKITPCFENGKAGLVSGMPNNIGAGSTEYFVNRPYPGVIYARYLLAFFKTETFMKAGELQMTGTVGHKRVPKEYLLKTEIPLAPFNEQKRIADKLDAVLARVDACRDRLDRIPSILKRLRQSVLTDAISGKLTEKWRLENGVEFKLEQTKLTNVCKIFSGFAFKKNQYSDSGSNLLQIANVGYGRTLWDEKNHIPFELSEGEFISFKLCEGDIVLALNRPITNETLKVAKLSKSDLPATIYQRVACLRPINTFNSQYVFLCLQSPYFLKQVKENLLGSDQPYLNTSTLHDLKIQSYCPTEQTEIVRRVESLFAYADRLDARYNAARAHVEKLTPSLLAKAFRGELVPQDPNDEPASELLARIASATPLTTKKKSTRKPAG